jgi:undecaprenyl-diphosphatase
MSHVIDGVARCFLFFTDLEIVIPALLIGFIWINRNLFYQAACLSVFSILVNVALKVSFQVPLLPTVGHKGFAFPSGHMQFATVLYTWLVFYGLKGSDRTTWKLSIKILTPCLLTGIGWALIHCGYHTLKDVIAAVFVGLCLVAGFQLAQNHPRISNPLYGLLLATLLLAYSFMQYIILPRYAWVAYLTLALLIIGGSLLKTQRFGKR